MGRNGVTGKNLLISIGEGITTAVNRKGTMQDYNKYVSQLTEQQIQRIPIQSMINYIVVGCETDKTSDMWWFYLLMEQLMTKYYKANKFSYTDTVTAPTQNEDTIIMSLCPVGALLDICYQSGETKHLITAQIRATQETEILRHIVTANNIHLGYAAPIAQMTDMLFALKPNDAIGFENGSLLICTNRTETQITVRLCEPHNYFSFEQYVQEQDKQTYIIDFTNTPKRIDVLKRIYTHIHNHSGEIHPLVYTDIFTTGIHLMDALYQSLAQDNSVVIQNNKASVDSNLVLQYLTYLRKKPLAVQTQHTTTNSFDWEVNEFHFYEQIESYLSQADYTKIYTTIMDFCREYNQSVSIIVRGVRLNADFEANSVEYVCSAQTDRPHFIKMLYNGLDFIDIQSMNEISCSEFRNEIQARYQLNLDYWKQTNPNNTSSVQSTCNSPIFSPFTINDITECSKPMKDLINYYWGGIAE